MRSALISHDQEVLFTNKPLTEFQKKCLAAIDDYQYVAPELGWIASRVNSNKLAVYSSMVALEKRGIVHSGRNGEDQWATIWVSYDKSMLPKEQPHE